MCDRDIVQEYLDAGKVLTLLDGKVPMVSNWTKAVVPPAKLFRHEGNLGWVIGSDDLVIDVDPRNGGDESWSALCSDLDLDLEPTVITPSGGFHIYLSGRDGVACRKSLKKYPGIDFLTSGSQCVVVSSSVDGVHYSWADEDFGLFEQSTVPEELMTLIGKTEVVDDAPETDLGDFEGLLGTSDFSTEDVVRMLEAIDHNVPNEQWVRVGMALKTWHPTDGLILWENWSQGGDTYVRGETAKRWKSFDVGTEGGVGVGTLVHMARDGAAKVSEDVIAKYITMIDAADERKLKIEVCPEISRDRLLDAEGRNRVAVSVQSRLTALTGVRPPVGVCRALVTASGAWADGEREVPRWCKRWVYVNSHAAFVDMKRLKVLKSQAFNLENGRHVAADERGRKPSAVNYVADNGFVSSVDVMNYLPMMDDKICEIEGRRVLNTFNKRSVPVEALEFTDGGEEAIRAIKDHLKFLCGNSRDAKILLMWLAHNVQKPGVKIIWSPVIQSIEGAGKSFLGALLRVAMGAENIGVVAPSQIVSQFNGWAEGTCVSVLEELRMQGHNRYDALNSIKPLITDEVVQINEKGIAPYLVVNVTNYICFTNHKDALPLGMTDRRWWVIFAAIRSLGEMEEMVGMGADVYFERLFGLLRGYGGEVRKWLLEYELTEEFLAMKVAPMTSHKEMMIRTEEAGVEGLLEVREMIDVGGEYYNSLAVCATDLFDQVLFDHPELNILSTKRHTIMKKLGYTLMDKVVKIDGKTRRVWVKKNFTNEEIREMFSKKG